MTAALIPSKRILLMLERNSMFLGDMSSPGAPQQKRIFSAQKQWSWALLPPDQSAPRTDCKHICLPVSEKAVDTCQTLHMQAFHKNGGERQRLTGLTHRPRDASRRSVFYQPASRSCLLQVAAAAGSQLPLQKEVQRLYSLLAAFFPRSTKYLSSRTCFANLCQHCSATRVSSFSCLDQSWYAYVCAVPKDWTESADN